MSAEISIREIKEMPDVSNTPFAMAILDDKGEIVAYGPYHEDFARYVLHIPLYTKPQLKPLTDEEIHELANQHLRTQDHDGSKVVTGLEDFARAIEERHGIK